jgi:hypothetical protein
MALALASAVIAREAATGSGPDAPIFVDVAGPAGLDFVHFNGSTGRFYMLEIMGGGGALLDYDNDGDLDLYLVQGTLIGSDVTLDAALVPPKHPLPLTDRLYRNDLEVRADGSRKLEFTDVTEATGLKPTAYGVGAATGDFDNDGWIDLYLTNSGSNQLLRNNGDGTFSDVTSPSGTDDAHWSVSASFLDYDRDGWLDLYVVNYVDFTVDKHKLCPSPTGARDYCGPLAYGPVVDRLFRNRGDGTFEDVSSKAGISSEARTGLGVVAADFDGDRWLDFYVANDGTSNQLYLNNRDGTFRDDTLLAGCAVNAEGVREASMGVDVADFDGDGDEDLFMTHLTGETNTLYINGGGGMFQDGTQEAGLGTPSWPFTSFGTRFLDYDNDGRLDLLTVSGAVYFFATGSRKVLEQTNQLFHNLGSGRFEEVTESAGEPFARKEVSRGIALGDIDNDGDPDVVMLNNNGPARLLLNQVGAEKGWLGLRLGGGQTPRDMLGARVALQRADRRPLWRRVQTDGSYASASDPRVLFGLAGGSSPSHTVRVYWPDGVTEEFSGLAPGQYHTLLQGSGKAIPE